MYRIESQIIERLREKDLNVDDLLQTHANVRKHKVKKIKEDILYATENLNKVIRTLEDSGMTTTEIIQMLTNAGLAVERVEND